MAEDRKPVRGRTPVSWHPLFPAVVAVWFGALFGLGVLAVRTVMLEAAVLALGIDRLLPAAAPPLGATARILLALGFALIGAAIGATIGLLMARSRPDAQARRAEAAAAKAATKAAETAEIPETVAEPGKTRGFFDISQLDLDQDMRIEAEPVFGDLPLQDEPAIEVGELEPEFEATLKPARAFERPLDPVSFPLPESFPLPGGAAAARLTRASLDSLSHVELIERLALSLQRRREEAVAPLDEPAQPAAIAAPDQAQPAPSYYPAVSEVAAEQGYASLLGLSRAATPADAAERESSVARFPEPGAPRPTSEATERALRDALATLQRMSGAA